jgi:hypothetical protein
VLHGNLKYIVFDIGLLLLLLVPFIMRSLECLNLPNPSSAGVYLASNRNE